MAAYDVRRHRLILVRQARRFVSSWAPACFDAARPDASRHFRISSVARQRYRQRHAAGEVSALRRHAGLRQPIYSSEYAGRRQAIADRDSRQVLR